MFIAVHCIASAAQATCHSQYYQLPSQPFLHCLTRCKDFSYFLSLHWRNIIFHERSVPLCR